MTQDLDIYKFIDTKVMTTTGEEQKEWIRKYDIFTCRALLKKENKLDKLKEVDRIREEVIHLINAKDKFSFWSTFTPCLEGGYTITFSDLPGCITEGDDMDECMKNAHEVLELHLWGMEKDKDVIPTPTEKQNIKIDNDEFLIQIIVDMKKVREELEK